MVINISATVNKFFQHDSFICRHYWGLTKKLHQQYFKDLNSSFNDLQESSYPGDKIPEGMSRELSGKTVNPHSWEKRLEFA